MSPDPNVRLRSATSGDAAFIVEMARHACVIEDWPLPDPDSDEVASLLPAAGEVPVVAVDDAGVRLGAVWTFHHDPPLRVDAGGVSLPELCIAVTPQRRGSGIGGLLLDELFVRLRGTVEAMCTNVHMRNAAQNLYQRNGFRPVGQGRGSLGVAMHKDFRVRS
ncbi:GNAT family N-acetyltransferase [Mycolicibacterium sp. P9-22]|uniref:GNAT family N-acetyltransferase n=1 Tax=Mycolicibacterium sp. P9-22 TaxID=2024613 RepID=UPI0011F00F54|nr:GNAT family N-acetyltransferase [Mycolicibacterium sp. P9-22]KAA0108757.1 N-acetyltransferase [Mycolicibacterium sp. P9-22]